MKARCRNGIEAESLKIVNNQGRQYIYGIYHENGKKGMCYIAPEVPLRTMSSTSVGYIVRPRIYASIILDILTQISEYIPSYPSEEIKNVSLEFGQRLIEIGKKIKETANELE